MRRICSCADKIIHKGLLSSTYCVLSTAYAVLILLYLCNKNCFSSQSLSILLSGHIDAHARYLRRKDTALVATDDLAGNMAIAFAARKMAPAHP